MTVIIDSTDNVSVAGIWIEYRTENDGKGLLNYGNVMQGLASDVSRLNKAMQETDNIACSVIMERINHAKRDYFPIIINGINDISIARIIGNSKPENIKLAKQKAIAYLKSATNKELSSIGNDLQGLVSLVYSCYFK